MTLDELKVGQDAVIQVVGGEGELRHHLLDMGLTPGTEVTLRKIAPMGDPIELELRGYELTLRLADAKKIEIEGVHTTDRRPGRKNDTRPSPTRVWERSGRPRITGRTRSGRAFRRDSP